MGELIQRLTYTPFGDDLNIEEPASVLPTNRYSGQPFDKDTGLYYYGARYYDAELGRFISPDTIVTSDPSDSQAFNPYSYALNNPLKFNDPDGHAPQGGQQGSDQYAQLLSGTNENQFNTEDTKVAKETDNLFSLSNFFLLRVLGVLALLKLYRRNLTVSVRSNTDLYN